MKLDESGRLLECEYDEENLLIYETKPSFICGENYEMILNLLGIILRKEAV